MTWSSWYYDNATRWWWRPWYPRWERRSRTWSVHRWRRRWRRRRVRRQRQWRPRTAYAEPDTMIEHVAPAGSCAAPAPVTEQSPTATNAAPDTVIAKMAPAGTCAAPAPVTEYAPTAAYAAPDIVIEYVAPAGTCAAPAPVSARCRVHRASTSSVLCCTSVRRVLCCTSARRRVHRASTSDTPWFTTEHVPTAACEAPDTEIEYVALAGICTAPLPLPYLRRGEMLTCQSPCGR